MMHLMPIYNADVLPAAFPWAPAVARQRVEIAVTLDNREIYNAAAVVRILAARDADGVDVPADNDALLEWLQS